MNNIMFKVASKGEGKTKWLLEIAHKYSKTHRVYLQTDYANDFSRFCEKYCMLFHEVCPVMRYSGVELDEKCVLLIDDLFAQTMSTTEVAFLSRHCYKAFITLEGKLALSEQRQQVDPNQLNIFDVMSDRS